MKKTKDKILTNFFWPGVRADVSRFNKSCDACQNIIQKGKVTRVPVERLPVIDVLFKRMSFDIVGPIYPASERLQILVDVNGSHIQVSRCCAIKNNYHRVSGESNGGYIQQGWGA